MSIYAPSSLEKVKGIGEVSLTKLNKAGIYSKFDLINFLPRAYQEIKFNQTIKDVTPGEITIKARAENIKLRRTSRVTTILTAELVDETDKLLAVWFNQPYRQSQLKKGQFYFSGKYEFTRGRYQLTNPSVQQVTKENANLADDHIRPIYSQVRGLKTSFFDKTTADLKPEILTLNESLPRLVLKQFDLMARSDSIYELHFPTSFDQIKRAKWRGQFEQYFIAGLASVINNLANRQQDSVTIKYDLDLIKQYLARLTFTLTADQKKAAWQIIQALGDDSAMNLLLQGDVGAGKTVVAEIASLVVAKAGYQVAFMAPTEILANQHFAKIKANLEPFGLKVELLTSSIKGKTRADIYQRLTAGEIDILIGTHALIQSEVEFKNLALAIIDEQHRFGVEQRENLIKKSHIRPHLLSMTATPIPRSLALTLKNELDIVSIKQKPANRLAIKTFVYTDKNKDLVYHEVVQQLEAGRQGYVVCGLIDEDEDEQVKSVENVYRQLLKKDLKNYKLAMLHGKMKPDQKQQIMTDFAAGKIDVLVATTVVEVGVDVANATFMVITSADRYGLSQLHQLRGRVGRGEHQSSCYLITEGDGSSERLQAIAGSEDGFYLAELDLKMRGMGDLYGKSQSGWFSLESDLAAIKEANAAIKFYLDYLQQNDLKLSEELAKLPELATRIDQYDHLTVLN